MQTAQENPSVGVTCKTLYKISERGSHKLRNFFIGIMMTEY